MKIFLFILSVCCIGAISSCKKSDDSTPAPGHDYRGDFVGTYAYTDSIRKIILTGGYTTIYHTSGIFNISLDDKPFLIAMTFDTIPGLEDSLYLLNTDNSFKNATYITHSGTNTGRPFALGSFTLGDSITLTMQKRYDYTIMIYDHFIKATKIN